MKQPAIGLAALRRVEAMSHSPLYAPTVEALIESTMLMAAQPLARALPGTSARRRIDRERADRLALDAGRASMRDAPAVWWHAGGSGPTLLLLNGWTASGLMWPQAFVTALEAQYRVIRIDNRGTGYSRTAPAPYLIRTMADDAADVLRSTDSGPAVVVGLSMGGMIAQELALRHPGRVARLVLVGTRPPAPAHIAAAPDVLLRALANPGPEQSTRAFVADMWTSFCSPTFDRHDNAASIDELVEQVFRRTTPKSAVNTQMRAIAAWHGPGRLAAIRCPTTVVHGSADRLMPVGNGMRLARLVPGARYVELPDVGHIVPMEAGQQLVEVINDADH